MFGSCRYHYGRPPRPFYVLLKVGLREFIGDGPTRQAARHSAASKALSVLKNLPMPRENKVKIEAEECADGEGWLILFLHMILLIGFFPRFHFAVFTFLAFGHLNLSR